MNINTYSSRLLFVLFLFFSCANSGDHPTCSGSIFAYLAGLGESVADGGRGATACSDALDNHVIPVVDQPWCTCFKWPEAVNAVMEEEPECYILREDQRVTMQISNFTTHEAYHSCHFETDCTEVQYQALCEAKNCIWIPDTDPAVVSGTCTETNPDRKDNNEAVVNASLMLEVPWMTDCEELMATYEYYREKTCDDLFDVAESGPFSDSLGITLRDVCGETCWYKDAGAPYYFNDSESQHCNSHQDCNDPFTATDIYDYFCADCRSCKDLGVDCGLCQLVDDIPIYDTNLCVPMEECTEDISIDGICASQIESSPLSGNKECTSSTTYKNFLIDSCVTYWENLDNDDLVADYMCPCHLDDAFLPIDCVWSYSFLYTLQENQAFCNATQTTCADIMSKDACMSTEANCVWLPRLVKGLCVSDPCLDSANSGACDYDSCLVCATDELGDVSCVPDMDKVGNSCDDHNSETEQDVCQATLELHPDDSDNRLYACRGDNAADKLEIPKFFDQCDESGETYSCYAPPSGGCSCNVTEREGKNCDNEVVSKYVYQMDGSCSNVLTTDHDTKIYFKGECDEGSATSGGPYVQIQICNETDFLSYLTESHVAYIQPDDSASSLGLWIVFTISLLLLLS